MLHCRFSDRSFLSLSGGGELQVYQLFKARMDLICDADHADTAVTSRIHTAVKEQPHMTVYGVYLRRFKAL